MQQTSPCMHESLQTGSDPIRLDIKSILGASKMVCRAAGDVIDRESSLRLKTSLSERKRCSRRISNLIERAGANLGFLE